MKKTRVQLQFNKDEPGGFQAGKTDRVWEQVITGDKTLGEPPLGPGDTITITLLSGARDIRVLRVRQPEKPGGQVIIELDPNEVSPDDLHKNLGWGIQRFPALAGIV